MTNKELQCLLYLNKNKKGERYYSGQIDGILGSKSKEGIENFQRDFGLEADGIVGESTEKALTHAVCYGMPVKKVETDKNVGSKTGTFWDEIKHFKKSEFKCKCGGKYCQGYPQEPKEKLIRIADKVRDHFGKPMTVSSGVRCKTHNTNVGGVSNSRHLSGKAMDFCVSGLPASLVLPYVQSQSGIRYAYAIDSSYVHMDIE